MNSQKESSILALAGLLHNPLFAPELNRIVPGQWHDAVQNAVGNSTTEKSARLAAGVEKPEKPSTSQNDKLLSVFCSLKPDGLSAPSLQYWPPVELRIEDSSLFPTAEINAGNALKEVWKNFLEQAQALRDVYKSAGDESLPLFIENLCLLMQHYLWSTPCGLLSLPDVSLYDHSRTTAALAAVESKDVLLMGGDISGLQDFIYTISADGAASALRGRSFYLQLLNESLPRLILRRLNLPITNLVYAGGGNFYLLIRSTDKAGLEKLQKDVSRILLAHHRGDLSLATASLPLKEEDFLGGRISEKWKEVGGELQHVKQRRFSELGNDLKTLFEPKGTGGDETKQCRVCGLEHPNTHERPDGKPRICPPCEEFEELGKELRKAQYLALSQIKEGEAPAMDAEPGTWLQVLKTFGFDVTIGHDDKAPTVTEPASLFALTDEAVKHLKPRVSLAVGRRYFVNVTPSITADEIKQLEEKRKPEDKEREKLDVKNVKPFDVLQEQSTGLKRLGILRMDVDNLGKLFSNGIESPCLARMASLSFAVSLYFEGWVEHLAEERNKKDGKDRLYSIYSGGDDLFFVGSWDAVIELAREIRRDLTRYAANHPGIHASAGVVLISGKYPLYQAAHDAGEEEETAKRYINAKGQAKNAITFLGQTIDWELFGMDDCKNLGTGQVHALMHQLEDMLQAKDNQPAPPRALLGILTDLQAKFSVEAQKRQLEGSDKNKRGERQVLFGPWQWLGFYYLKRMIRREESHNKGFAKKVEQLTDQLQEKQFSNIEWIGLSARWAELLGRKSK